MTDWVEKAQSTGIAPVQQRNEPPYCFDATDVTPSSPCVAVINEDYAHAADNAQDWIDFRVSYPNRPFCLIIPYRDDEFTVSIPADTLADPNFQVHNVSKGYSEWFSLCGLDKMKSSDVKSIGLFIDVGVGKYEVRSSYNKFLTDAAEANMKVCEEYDGNEDWIGHFSEKLSPDKLSCIGPQPVEFTCGPADDCTCIDDNKCTKDWLDRTTTTCVNNPLTCPSNQSCDPVDG